jgi:hypothetical protein
MNAASRAILRKDRQEIIKLAKKIRFQIEFCDHLEFDESLNELYYDFFLLVEESVL